jgi:hypothetical protein
MLLLITSACHAQVRLGVTKDEIEKEFDYLYVKKDVTSSGTECVTFTTRKATVSHLIDSAGVSFCAVLTPLGDAELKYYIERYNSDYVVISPTQWRVYGGETYADIELQHDKGRAYFLWK